MGLTPLRGRPRFFLMPSVCRACRTAFRETRLWRWFWYSARGRA
jgi:hypothetical protein